LTILVNKPITLGMHTVFSFESWFAGFVDGEGSFIIQRSIRYGERNKSPCVTFYPSFHIGLREDDRPVLEIIKSNLGIGYTLPLHRKGKYIYERSFPNTKDQYMYRVNRKSDSARLVEIFRTYPLQSRKANDFAIWATAVEEKQKQYPDRLLLQYLFEKLKYERRFGNRKYKDFTSNYIPTDIPRELIERDRRFNKNGRQ